MLVQMAEAMQATNFQKLEKRVRMWTGFLAVCVAETGWGFPRGGTLSDCVDALLDGMGEMRVPWKVLRWGLDMCWMSTGAGGMGSAQVDGNRVAKLMASQMVAGSEAQDYAAMVTEVSTGELQRVDVWVL